MCRRTGPGRCITGGERLFAGFVYIVIGEFSLGLFFWLRGIGRRSLFRLRFILFTHKNRTIQSAKGFAHLLVSQRYHWIYSRGSPGRNITGRDANQR